jgi:redox-sensing transcriptional repressor
MKGVGIMSAGIPIPTVERLAITHTLLERLLKSGKQTVSSSELGKLMGVPSHTIRKDISYLGQAGGETGYNISVLMSMFEQGLGFNIRRKACIVGLGRLGTSIMDYTGFAGSNIRIEVGFDSNINRIETMKTDIPLYPAYRIPEIVRRQGIEIGVIAVPVNAAELTAKRLIEGGIKGIINFAPVIIKCDSDDIVIRNVHLLEEFRIVSALISMDKYTKGKEETL